MGLSRDVYANLLRDTRGLRREQARARDAWYAGLSWERKEETLFELEMLLKGFACFGNRRNHAGPPRQTPIAASDYREELSIVRDALAQSIARIRELLGERDRAYEFSRYLETVLPEDALRTRLIKEQLHQDSPEESLFVLRNTFGSFLEMAEGMLRLDRISHRLYTSLLNTICREVGRNTYFNPLLTLEFRVEFDRIRSAPVLEALEATSDAAHRVVALASLSLFRALRYVDLIDRYASSASTARLSHVILSVLRSDMRALTRYLGERAGDSMADAFERVLIATPAGELRFRQEQLAHQASALLSMRRTLESLANVLRIEVRRTFERDFGPPGAATKDLASQLIIGAAGVRATLHHVVNQLCLEIQPTADAPPLGNPVQTRRLASERLRRDVWMFSQVLRGFLAKAEATTFQQERDVWAGLASFHFVREFLHHFRAIGYQLVRTSDYPRLDHFMGALEALRDVDLTQPERLRKAVRECRTFYEYLRGLFEDISQRAELSEAPFDRKAAAETLRIYLGAA